MPKIDFSQLRKSLDNIMQAAGKADSAARNALNTGSEALKDFAKKNGPNVMDALRHPGATGRRIMQAAERADIAGRKLLDRGSELGKAGLGALGMKAMGVMGDTRLSGLGGTRGLEAKIRLARGGLKLADWLTNNGKAIDPSLTRLPGARYHGSLYQKLYGLWAGTARRADVNKTMGKLTDADARNLNQLIADALRDPADTGRRMMQAKHKATYFQDSELPEQTRKEYGSLARLFNEAARSRTVNTETNITNAQHDELAKAYISLMYGKHGGPGFQDATNAGGLAAWGERLDGTRRQKAWREEGKTSANRGQGWSIFPPLSHRSANAIVGRQNVQQEYLRLGKTGDPLLPGGRPLTSDIGFAGFNNAGVFNAVDPVYFNGRSGLALARSMADSDVPMGSMMELNIAEQLVRAANNTPGGKKLHIKYLGNGVWYDKGHFPIQAPKAVVVNDAGLPFWGEIVDAHHIEYPIAAKGFVTDRVSRRAMDWLNDRTRQYDQTMQGLPQVYERLRGDRRFLLNPRNPVFDLRDGNTTTATHVDPAAAFEKLRVAKPKTDLEGRELLDYLKSQNVIGDVTEKERDDLIDVVGNPRAVYDRLVKRQEKLRARYADANARFRANALNGNDVTATAEGTRLLQELGAGNVRNKSEAELANIVRSWESSGDQLSEADIQGIVTRARQLDDELAPYTNDALAVMKELQPTGSTKKLIKDIRATGAKFSSHTDIDKIPDDELRELTRMVVPDSDVDKVVARIRELDTSRHVTDLAVRARADTQAAYDSIIDQQAKALATQAKGDTEDALLLYQQLGAEGVRGKTDDELRSMAKEMYASGGVGDLPDSRAAGIARKARALDTDLGQSTEDAMAVMQELKAVSGDAAAATPINQLSDAELGELAQIVVPEADIDKVVARIREIDNLQTVSDMDEVAARIKADASVPENIVKGYGLSDPLSYRQVLNRMQKMNAPVEDMPYDEFAKYVSEDYPDANSVVRRLASPEATGGEYARLRRIVREAARTKTQDELAAMTPEQVDKYINLRTTDPMAASDVANYLRDPGAVPARRTYSDLLEEHYLHRQAAGMAEDLGYMGDPARKIQDPGRRGDRLDQYNTMMREFGLKGDMTPGNGKYAEMFQKLTAAGMKPEDKYALLHYIATGKVADGYTMEQLNRMLLDSKLVPEFSRAWNRSFTIPIDDVYIPTVEDAMDKTSSLKSAQKAFSDVLDALKIKGRSFKRGWDYWMTPPKLSNGMQARRVEKLLEGSDTFIPSWGRLKTRLGQAAHNPRKAINAAARAPIDLFKGSIWAGNPSAIYSRKALANDLVVNLPDLPTSRHLADMNLMNRARQLTALEGAAATGTGLLWLNGLHRKMSGGSEQKPAVSSADMSIATLPGQEPEVDVQAPATLPATSNAPMAQDIAPVAPEPEVAMQPKDRRFSYKSLLPGLAGLGVGASVYAMTSGSKSLRRHRLARMLLAAGLGGMAAYGTHRYMTS